MDISIIMLAYKHERFIAQALESVLMQKTEYSYELIVGEDCSPDGTRAILKGYEPKFGGRMKPLYRDKNMGMRANWLDCVQHAQGRYIAFLEGDDYWTDPEKLQKQAAFLDAHPEYAVTMHNWSIVDREGKFLRQGFENDQPREYGKEDMKDFVIPAQTATIMAHNIFAALTEREKRALQRYQEVPMDRLAYGLFLARGKIYIAPESMSCYRWYIETNGSNWSSQHEQKPTQQYYYFFKMMLSMERFLKEVGQPVDLFEPRAKEFFKARAGIEHFPDEKASMVRQQLLILWMEPHKLRLCKAVLRHRKERRETA